MLSVQRPEAPPVAAMQDQDEDQSFGLYVADETKSQCRISVVSALPDIDPDYLTRVCTEAQWDANQVIDRIFDQIENGKPYPRVPKQNLLKRKRADDEEPSGRDKTAARFDNEERRQQLKATSYKKTCDMIMQQSFPEFYAEDLRRTFAGHGNCLYPAFLEVAATVASSNHRPPYRKKSRVIQIPGRYDVDALADRIRTCTDQGERDALEEFQALREVQAKQHAESEVERKREETEKSNLEAAVLEGNVADCGCCFVEHALNRMVHCDGETLHWFCRDCSRMMAETQIGLSKYQLGCMSTDGCAGSFAMDQKEIFLDANSMTALDRIEQEAVLREAGIENLETCPQCPFAAEYPPIEEDKEFRCLNPDCAVTSCRSCRKETHIPKTCAEAALDNGHSARHDIEEAMSAALIRTCNKCSAPFIKENGCNKMTCTKCRNIQCYVCSKSCDYSHFNDTSRGGKTGNCPLFDGGYGVEKRHRDEVRAAEEQARKKALEEHPEVQADLLEFQLSEKVKKDEEEKSPAHQHIHHRPHHHHHRPGGRIGRLVRFNVGRDQALEQAHIAAQMRAAHLQFPAYHQFPAPPRAAAPAPPPPAPAAAAPLVAPPVPPRGWEGDEFKGIPPELIEARPPHNIPDHLKQVLADQKHRPLFPPLGILRRRPQAPHAQVEVAPVPALQGAGRPDPLPRDQAVRPVQQAPQAAPQAQAGAQAQAQAGAGAYVDLQAMYYSQAQIPAMQPQMDFWQFMNELSPAKLHDQPVLQLRGGGLHDNYRQGEHPEASPVGNGPVGGANQVDHRPWNPPEDPAMIDAMGWWQADPPLRNLEDLPGLDMDDLHDMARGPFPVAENDGAGLDFNFGAAAPFGFDDLVFR